MGLTPTAQSARILGGLLDTPTPFLFFTGKGGVGKTSAAAATALALAETGTRVLIVSTDPASNLDEVLEVTTTPGAGPVPVPGVAGLHALNIDPEAAAATYRERVIGPYRGVLPPVAVAQMEEELSGSCTVEVAAFNEFVALLADPELVSRYDHVVFDTAPTGHTLRLLTLPAAWTGFLTTNTSGVTCIGPVSALGQAQDRYATAVTALRDPARTAVVLVTRPDAGALAEANRASQELTALGLHHQQLVINGVFTAADPDDAIARAWQQRAEQALDAMPQGLRGLASAQTIPLLPVAPLGPAGLRLLLHPDHTSPAPTLVDDTEPLPAHGLAALVTSLRDGGPKVIMTMGKGGVGKTTIAAAVAVALADTGCPVTLTTTDPAAHVADVLPDPPFNLTVTRIDPAEQTAAYQARVLAQAGASLDTQAYALLEEDLRSPCTEEVAVFEAFARTVAAAGDRYVVIDTAPTGHTLLLLDASRGFTRQLANQSGQVSTEASRLLDTLTDADRTRILLVTLAEPTPVHEAAKLQADLARAGITPFCWVANASLAATTTTDPVLAARGRQERRWLAEVTRLSARPPAVVAWTPVPPIGAAHLATLAGSPTASL